MKPGEKVVDEKRGDDYVVVRYVDERDTQAMLEYINEISKEQTFISFQGEQLTLDEEQEHVDKVLKGINDKSHVKFVLIVAGVMCGMCEVSLGIRTHTHVGGLGLSISSHVRDKGLGRLLLETTIDEAKKNLTGLRMVELTVFANNPVAIGLYKSCGFVEVGRIPNKIFYKGNYVDEIVMYLKV